MPVRYFRIQGRVQGVGYRAFTLRQARSLGLGGYVRNLSDGSVEAVAVGEAGPLADLESRLREGPAGSQVDSVEVREEASDPGPGAFRIR
jgi:acylphosphatase